LAFSIKPEELIDAVRGLRALNIRGMNVTIPHKEAVIPLLDEIDPLAKKIGAVNTIVNNKAVFKGYNTDVPGLIRMVEDDGGFSISGKKAMIVGAGGAARAAGIALLQQGIKEIYLVNRTVLKAEKLAADWKKYYNTTVITGALSPDFYSQYIKDIDLLIDTTPVGMSPEVEVPPVIEENYLHSNLLVVDLVYNPAETSLLKAACRSGAQTMNGMGMLLYQGIESFKIWTGRDIDVNTWWSIVDNL
ncbi:MAG: shikimate dehydrogenase, partial [Bacillota bacterium]